MLQRKWLKNMAYRERSAKMVELKEYKLASSHEQTEITTIHRKTIIHRKDQNLPEKIFNN